MTRTGIGRLARLAASVGLCAVVLTGCSGGFNLADINPFTKFSPWAYGVKASPRVTNSRNVPKGGGRAIIGAPYKVAGRWYTPRLATNYDQVGMASWYGPNFHGRLTANGEVFDQYGLSAAHPTLPLPSYVRVSNLENNRSIIVRVNDRGPYAQDRLIDVSREVADKLGFANAGTAEVRVQYVGPAPLEGDDTRMLMASYNAPSVLERDRGTPRIALAALDTIPVPAQSARRTTPMAFSVANNLNGSSPVDLMFYARPAGLKVPDGLISGAFAATEAMATGQALTDWQQRTDLDARKVSLALGAFANPQTVDRIALKFAMLGAVDTEPVTVAGKPAVALSLTWLKPGVGKSDVLDLARTLGLEGVAFRN